MPKVLVTGGTGFLGRALVRALYARGDTVTVLSRRPLWARRSFWRQIRVVSWTPNKSGPWCEEVSAAEAVVHLAGEPVAARWTVAKKKSLIASRVGAAQQLVLAMKRLAKPPRVLITASAIGYYGADRPGERLTEDAAPGSDFLARLCTGWEAAAAAADVYGVRSVALRIGVVLGPGGALAKMMLPGRLGVIKFGSDRRRISWIHQRDVIGMILMAIDDEALSGSVNCTSPFGATAGQLAAAVGLVHNRPTVRVPLSCVNALLGEAATIFTGSLDVYPDRAVELGYAFEHARLIAALEASFVLPGSAVC